MSSKETARGARPGGVHRPDVLPHSPGSPFHGGVAQVSCPALTGSLTMKPVPFCFHSKHRSSYPAIRPKARRTPEAAPQRRGSHHRRPEADPRAPLGARRGHAYLERGGGYAAWHCDLRLRELSAPCASRPQASGRRPPGPAFERRAPESVGALFRRRPTPPVHEIATAKHPAERRNDGAERPEGY